ncbi:MAG: serine/threonine protein kinase [Planctomycetes bacterium]|nr:serine/threonine protein kinase [Planctomycetota bacterium]
MPAADDSSDSGLRDALAGFAAEVEPAALRDVQRRLDAALGDDDHLGDYRIGKELGRGGMGIVYEAEQLSAPGHIVALKVLLGFAASETARRRFAREVEVTRQLDHPHIVPVLAADLGGPRPYYTMQRIVGVSLRDLLRTGALRDDCRRTATMIRDLARALQHAHDHGVVHRDVKPGNVIVEAGDRALLLDFGLARVLTDDAKLTHSLDAVGTPDYMAPEQLAGRRGDITPRTDIYGLGITLYECLTGSSPFASGSNVQTAERIRRGDAPRIRRRNQAVPRDLETICSKAMAAAPAHRYATAAAFADDLDAFLHFRPIAARPAPRWHRVRIVAQRHPLLATASAAAAVVFALAGIWWGWWVPTRDTNARLAGIEALWHRCVEVEARLLADRVTLRTRQQREWQPGLDPELGPLQRELRRLGSERDQARAELETALETCLALAPEHPRTNQWFARLVALQLRELLAGAGIMTHRERIAQQQQRLQRFDRAGEHAALLDERGELTIACAAGAAEVWLCPLVETPDGRAIHVGADDAAAVALGTTPWTGNPREGSYAIRATRDGHEDLVVPVLIRRRAMQSDRERRVDLTFATREDLGDGFVQVHGGLAVPPADDSDPTVADEREAIPGFAMTQHEVRFQDVIDWLGAMPPELASGKQGSMLAGLQWPQIAALLHHLNRREHRLGTAFWIGLPTPAEWRWAGQGADGRPYPWGWQHDWGFSQNYWSSVDADMRLPQERWPDTDISPFGIRHLAGSLREVCLPRAPMREIGNKQFLLCGGCYYSFRASDLQLGSQRSLMNDETAVDTGLRLVRRRLSELPTGSATLHLPRAGEAPPGVPVGWRLLGTSGPFAEDLTGSSRAVSTGDGLRLLGYGGHFSPQLLAWHPLACPSATTTLTTTFSFDVGREPSRTLEIRLGERPDLEARDAWLGCQIHVDWFGVSGGGNADTPLIRQPLPAAGAGETHALTLTVTPQSVAARLARGRAAPMELQIPRPEGLPATWRYVGLRLPTAIGLRVTFTELTVGP